MRHSARLLLIAVGVLLVLAATGARGADYRLLPELTG